MRMKLIFTLAMLLLLPALSRANNELLDGSKWKAQLVPTTETEEKGAERFEDLLTFERGRLSSRELGRQGIGPVEFTAEGTSDFLNWKTAPMLREKNAAQWSGTVREGKLEGTLEWRTAGGKTLYFFLHGDRQ